jgi:hypothetical protein
LRQSLPSPHPRTRELLSARPPRATTASPATAAR